MRILGIETSCDETGAAVIEGEPGDTKVKLLSNVVASSLSLHAKTGGIVPEVAAREQVKYIIPVIEKALTTTNISQSTTNPSIDAIAVTVGPGLIGSLLVGVETAKTLAYVWKKPIIPVNHLIGHIYANWILTTNNSQLTTTPLEISNQKLEVAFPAIVLIVSGGHTDLVLMKNHKQHRWIGGTRDDAAGEAFDKIGRLLELPYPGGPVIAKLAEKGNPKAFSFPRPMIDSSDFDFSFSGLKTAVLREVKNQATINDLPAPRVGAESETGRQGHRLTANLSASVQQAIVDVLVAKTTKAAQKHKVKSMLISGGVAANELLRHQLEVRSQELGVIFFAPAKNLCTDNAAMITTAAFFHYKPLSWQQITADPGLHF